MKFIEYLKAIILSIWRPRNAAQLQLLKKLNQLVSDGIETQVEVLDTKVEEERIGKLYEVQLWVRFQKSDHTFIYTHCKTLLQWNKIPTKGQILKVRYLPENLNSVLLV